MPFSEVMAEDSPTAPRAPESFTYKPLQDKHTRWYWMKPPFKGETSDMLCMLSSCVGKSVVGFHSCGIFLLCTPPGTNSVSMSLLS